MLLKTIPLEARITCPVACTEMTKINKFDYLQVLFTVEVFRDGDRNDDNIRK